jgi:sigma-B regulation protein RsbU (phosphoserine phosphatase)
MYFMKILIADDDKVSRLVLAHALTQLGHEVLAAENGSDALSALRQSDFHILISDWMMPGMDGPTLCREVRKLPAEDYTYIILLTALEGKSNYLEAMDAGADDFLTKPFDAEWLASRIHVAARIVGLQHKLAETVHQLREKNDQIEEELKMAQDHSLRTMKH